MTMTTAALSSVNLTTHNDAVMRAVLHALENNLGLGSAVTGVGFSDPVLIRLRAIRAQLHPDAEWLRLGGALDVLLLRAVLGEANRADS